MAIVTATRNRQQTTSPCRNEPLNDEDNQKTSAISPLQQLSGVQLLRSSCCQLLGRSCCKLLGRSGSKLLLPGLRCFPLGGVEALDHPGAVAAVRCVQHGQVRRDVQYEEVHKQVADLVADAAGHLSTDTHKCKHSMHVGLLAWTHVTGYLPRRCVKDSYQAATFLRCY